MTTLWRLSATEGNWRHATLDEIGAIVTGKTPSSAHPGHFGGDIPFVTPSDFDGRRRIDHTARSLTESGVASLGRVVVPPNAVMVSCIGSDMGKAAMTLRRCVTNQQINSIVIGRNTDPLFVYYNLSARKEEIRRVAGGSAQPILNKSAFGRLDILLPPLGEQRAIASIPGALDDKIELNRKMSATLEAIARAIFKSWFVDFDPVRAKAEGRDTGLPAEIAALFPDSFEDSELGEIPKGWSILRLSEVLEETNERIGVRTAPEYSSTNEGLQQRSERFKKTLALSPAKNKLIRNGYFVFGLSRQLLNFGLMRDALGSVSAAYKVFKVVDPAVYPDLLERLIRGNRSYFYGAVSASSREGQAVSTEGLGLLHFVNPPRVIQDSFYRIGRTFACRIQACELESHTLGSLRDALLPKLISGELRVPEAEHVVEQAV